MNKLKFSSIKEIVVPCPNCGHEVSKVVGNGDSVKFGGNADFIDGDTCFHEYFGTGDKWTEYSQTVVVYACKHCETEFFEIELCVPSEHHTSRMFIQDGFEKCEREELYRVESEDSKWICLRKINVDDRMGNDARQFRHYDLHVIGPFTANRAVPAGSSVMSCQPSQLWVDAADMLYKYGPACLEYMREWRKEAGDE